MARDTKPAKLSPIAHAKLLELRKGLRRAGLPEDVKLEDLLSALVFYTPAPQAAGMLMEYQRYTGELEERAKGAPQD